MTTPSSGDIFALPAFRWAEESNGVWCTAAHNQLQRENPSIGRGQKVADAFSQLITNRRLIPTVCNDETTSMDNRITEGFIQGPIKEYIQLLHYAQSHMNLGSGAIKGMVFGWKSCNGAKKVVKLSSTSSGFEYASMLTVAAGCYARMAQREIIINGVEGAKNAFKYFQHAAGIHQHIGERFLRSFTTTDKNQNGELTEQGNEQMVKLFLAYAHHAALIKAEAEMPTKYTILSKLAMEGSNAYTAVAQLARRYSQEQTCLLRDMPLDIEDSAGLNAHILRAKANYFLAQEQADKQAFGVAIGRFNKALDALNLANQVAAASTGFTITREHKAWLLNFRTLVDNAADKAVHENSTLYFERVQNNLPDPEASGKPFGKPTPFDQIFALSTTATSAKTQDPFFGVIPVHVLSTVTDWKSKIRDTITKISESVAAHKARTQSALQACGVHAAIQVATTENKARGTIPADLKDRILKIRGITDPAAKASYSNSSNGTAVDGLVTQIDHITNVAQFCRDSITGIEEKFNKEAHEDAVKREAYGAKVWGEIRKPLVEHPDGKAILFSLNDFKSALVKEADEPLVKAKQLLQANLREVLMIDWPLGDLNNLMPYTESHEAQKASEAAMAEIQALQRILKDIAANDEAEQVKIADLRAIGESDEIAHLLSSTPFEQHQEVVDRSRKVFNERLGLVTALMNETDRLVEAAQHAMTTYATLQSTDGVTAEVQEVCNKIIEALNIYDAVAQDVNTIAKFVDTVADQVEATSGAADSLILVRTMEAEDLATSLDAQVAHKIEEMEKQEAARKEAEAARQRQEDIKAQLAWLEKEQAAGNVYVGTSGATAAAATAATATTASTAATAPTTAAGPSAAAPHGVPLSRPPAAASLVPPPNQAAPYPSVVPAQYQQQPNATTAYGGGYCQQSPSPYQQQGQPQPQPQQNSYGGGYSAQQQQQQQQPPQAANPYYQQQPQQAGYGGAASTNPYQQQPPPQRPQQPQQQPQQGASTQQFQFAAPAWVQQAGAPPGLGVPQSQGYYNTYGSTGGNSGNGGVYGAQPQQQQQQPQQQQQQPQQQQYVPYAPQAYTYPGSGI